MENQTWCSRHVQIRQTKQGSFVVTVTFIKLSKTDFGGENSVRTVDERNVGHASLQDQLLRRVFEKDPIRPRQIGESQRL